MPSVLTKSLTVRLKKSQQPLIDRLPFYFLAALILLLPLLFKCGCVFHIYYLSHTKKGICLRGKLLQCNIEAAAGKPIGFVLSERDSEAEAKKLKKHYKPDSVFQAAIYLCSLPCNIGRAAL
jgi:hypothetical protein